MQVPFLDLKAQYEAIKPEIHQALQAVIDKTAFAGGPFVTEFEQAFAPFCGCRECVGVGSGTEALWIALRALGVGPGDAVATVPNTFIATAEAISFCGATPIFVDIAEDTCTMDPHLLEDCIQSRLAAPKNGQRLKAILPVHLYGQTADMDPILELADRYELAVVEDGCQAHGAEYKGRRAGSLGVAGAFSFYPGKNLGAYGEAGAVTTNNTTLAEQMRIFRDHGQPRRYYHDVVGWNGRMDGFQGAVLKTKLVHLERWNDARNEKAAWYRRQLADLDEVVLPGVADYARHVYHLFAIRVRHRDRVLAALTEKGIGCGIHYPVPVHLQKAYAFLGHRPGDFPVAERIAAELLSLPIFPELTEEQVAYVAASLRDIVTTRNR
ncbi:MAG: DegT/DnrJ/EryC1/StrS family aminotransferase [Deltaproteobacteria bacterium]|nr:DegT/DnrJ/EryC1/StrS family aminotransferase [Deltaproteobacteria bacterium]